MNPLLTVIKMVHITIIISHKGISVV